MSLKEKLKKFGVLVFIYLWWQSSLSFFRFRIFKFIKGTIWFWQDYFSFKKKNTNPKFTLELKDMTPCLSDKLSYTPIDPIYFFQDSWAAGKVFKINPAKHIDVGSSVKTVGIISQFVPTTMVDIRPIKLTMEGLSFVEGSILELPFLENSVECISSICVIEHIGLGRYGDPIDSWGSEKAIAELKRVTQKGGHILFSVPIDDNSKIYFNAHRAFTREYIIALFNGCELIEEKYIYKDKLLNSYDPLKGFGVGLYMFRKK
jgi:SAM-dependent methyltransferase